MIAFVDSSVVLRKLFSEPNPLKEWSLISEAYASRLLPIEIARVIDRYRLQNQLSDKDVATLRVENRRLLRSLEIIRLTEPILNSAAGAMPTIVGSLDAIHLSTALELQLELAKDIVLATHDLQLATAARASNLLVIGCD